MIKTMLLTAQLALSPIVGTNGLQPKRLPNPVYGETTDYSVTYNGETYTRVMSGDYYAENVRVNAGGIFWGYHDPKKQEICSDELGWTAKTNILKEESNYYLNWRYEAPTYIFEEVNLEPKTCVSFWSINIEGYDQYTEVYQGDGGATTRVWSFVRNGNTLTVDDYYSQAVPDNLLLGAKIYAHDPYETINWGTENPRSIPNYQPTIANPSIYDNIYNFYYQNLFANEALDELGAKVGNNSLTMRQWLAHTATIVSISLLAAALAFLVIKIFKLIAGSISDIWG